MDNSFVLAKYLRISSDDGTHGDSQSITGQRDLINAFVQSHPELKKVHCVEYCDDGFSGTSFERPGVKQLLDDIKTGKVHGIVVKDFSRFGRNYIEVGDYIEQVFPFLRIRFISINDGYDSATQQYNAGDVGIAFKHLCNDYYCKDLSRKVKSGLKTLWKSGKYLSSYPLFGFRKDPTDIHRLIIDEDAAAIVRRIFNMAMQGVRPSLIVATLNREGVPTPLMYLTKKKNVQKWSKRSLSWTNNKVIEIIRDLRYTGTMTNGMYEVTGFASRRSRKTKQSDWYITENTHEPIVSKVEYDKAQLCIRKIKKGADRSQTLTKSPYSFPVKIRCGGCGHAMVKNSAKKMAYYCKYRRTAAFDGCFDGKIEVETLRAILLASIQQLYKAVVENDRLQSESIANPPVDSLKQRQSMQREIERLTNHKLSLYKNYSDGMISREDYFAGRKSADETIQKLSSQLHELEQEYAQFEATPASDSIVSKVLGGTPYPVEYTPELVAALVDCVIVHDETRVEIKWKFADFVLQ